jgi:hypothetical protein
LTGVKRQCAAVVPGGICRVIDALQPAGNGFRLRMALEHVDKYADILRHVYGHFRFLVHAPNRSRQTGRFMRLRNPAATLIVNGQRKAGTKDSQGLFLVPLSGEIDVLKCSAFESAAATQKALELPGEYSRKARAKALDCGGFEPGN